MDDVRGVAELAHLWRRNRIPTLTVRADVEGAQAPDVTAALQPNLDALAKGLPLGYGIEVDGATESSAKAQCSVFAVMPVTIIAVLVLLMIQLQDMRKMALVLLTALAAILAMVPLTRSVFRGPMAWAIMGGLFVATLLTLNFLPALYATWYRAQPALRPAVPSYQGVSHHEEV